MSVDLTPLQRALRDLRYTTPLSAGDPSYVNRPDRLGERILNRIMVPSARRLLLAGPAGSGKSTELLQHYQTAFQQYTVILCPCDRELDLFHLQPQQLFRYVLWKLLEISSNGEHAPTTREIVRDAKALLGIKDVFIHDPRRHFSVEPNPMHDMLVVMKKAFAEDASEPTPEQRERYLRETLDRFVSEIERSSLPVLFVIDGLEKLSVDAFSRVGTDLIRSPLLDRCHSLIVVPQWSLYGWRSLARDEEIDTFEVPAVETVDFVEEVIRRRTSVFEDETVSGVARLSGGIVRDALELATNACRAALDEGVQRIAMRHLQQAKNQMVRAYSAIFSDDPLAVAVFLQQVRNHARLPGEPQLRDRLMACGAILPRPDGSFRVHPVLSEPSIEEQLS